MAGHSEDSALTKSCLERMSSVETKVTERINSLEWQLKKGHKQVNELRRNVEKLVKNNQKTAALREASRVSFFSLPDQHKG